MWMVYVAVAVDLASDGMMIGSGYTVSASLAFALAGGQVLADLPEGYAAAANFRRKKVPRRRRLMLSASFMLYVIVAAVGAFTFLRNTSRTVQLAVLVFIAGLLVVAAVEDMLREAHGAREDTRRSVLAFVGGFSLFALVSAGFDR